MIVAILLLEWWLSVAAVTMMTRHMYCARVGASVLAATLQK